MPFEHSMVNFIPWEKNIGFFLHVTLGLDHTHKFLPLSLCENLRLTVICER